MKLWNRDVREIGKHIKGLRKMIKSMGILSDGIDIVVSSPEKAIEAVHERCQQGKRAIFVLLTPVAGEKAETGTISMDEIIEMYDLDKVEQYKHPIVGADVLRLKKAIYTHVKKGKVIMPADTARAIYILFSAIATLHDKLTYLHDYVYTQIPHLQTIHEEANGNESESDEEKEEEKQE